VRSTLPLLIKHGGTVSTSQIAAAAGIAEGTVFRAFRDKQDLLIACMQAGMNSDEEVAVIEGIGADGALHERLARGVEAVSGYLDRIYAIGQAMRTSGLSAEDMRQRMHGDDDQEVGPPPEVLRVSRAMSGLFDKATDNLRVDTERAARMLLGLVFTHRMQDHGFGESLGDPAEVVDLFLHGVIHTTDGNHR
jgi:AcrR family transcriptional regulator